MQKYSTYQFHLSFFSYNVAAKIEKDWLPILIHKCLRHALSFLLGTKIIVTDTLQDLFFLVCEGFFLQAVIQFLS